MMALLSRTSLLTQGKNMSAAINLTKGSSINIQKRAPSLKRVRVGLGWDTASGSGYEFDLDASAFICQNKDGRPQLLSNEHFVFYNNVSDPDRALQHTGDNRTGMGDGDDESIIVDLDRVNPSADEISFIVTIHDAHARRQNFGQVRNSYIAIYNDETSEEIAKYRLEDNFTSDIAVQFGSLYRENGQWSFKAVGNGLPVGLVDIIVKYGGNVG